MMHQQISSLACGLRGNVRLIRGWYGRDEHCQASDFGQPTAQIKIDESPPYKFGRIGSSGGGERDSEVKHFAISGK